MVENSPEPVEPKPPAPKRRPFIRRGEWIGFFTGVAIIGALVAAAAYAAHRL